MLKNLLNYLKSLTLCKGISSVLISNNQEPIIPLFIEDKERIVRSIFSPINVNLKNHSLRTNAFKSPAEIDEVSVNRLDYSNADFCKSLSKKIEDPSNKRNYFGLAVLDTSEIRESKAEVIYSPIENPEEYKNPYHSDIKVGYIREKGQEAAAEITYIVHELTEKARFYPDPFPELDDWKGSELL